MIPTNPLTGEPYSATEVEAIYAAGETITNRETGVPYSLNDLQILLTAPAETKETEDAVTETAEAEPVANTETGLGDYVPVERPADPEAGPVNADDVLDQDRLTVLTEAEASHLKQFLQRRDFDNFCGYLVHCLMHKAA